MPDKYQAITLFRVSINSDYQEKKTPQEDVKPFRLAND
jgi:hypothetical protein